MCFSLTTSTKYVNGIWSLFFFSPSLPPTSSLRIFHLDKIGGERLKNIIYTSWRPFMVCVCKEREKGGKRVETILHTTYITPSPFHPTDYIHYEIIYT